MVAQLVECIPNFSEGRRPEIVDAIVDAIRSVAGITLLDRSSDADHNRSVVTFVGAPDAVLEAAFRGIAKAATLIDMSKHQGEHPRMGASDVVPLVPISGVDMPACIALAKRLGERVGKELGIPVYLYEEAATRPERKNLENVRRGEYEGIKEFIASDPDRDPDYGPAQIGPAGAVAIGARQPLIAYNVYLTTDDVAIAKKIAKKIRFSSGGLPFVKAAGFLVDGKAQVSMNLTNFRETPVAQVVDLIRAEAQTYGVSVDHSELIGLAPQEALEDAAAHYLQISPFDRNQILERRLQEAGAGNAEAPDFIEALALGTATPGGGSAAAHAGALAAALAAMVGRLTIGKKKYADVEVQMTALVQNADALRAAFLTAVDKDIAAFEAVMAAFKLPKESDSQKNDRQVAIEAATLEAARQPLAVAGMAVDCLRLVSDAARFGNLNAISDAGTAAALARACLAGAGLNVRTNVHSLAQNKEAAGLVEQLRSLEKEAAKLEGEIRAQLHTRGGFELD